mmetsp:Transcript_23763/g.27048  ORF Transcript_23763/g.27048 Transcript_23763/m.27048 type:complete len:155 (-) Transcript_23763:46-510(-)
MLTEEQKLRIQKNRERALEIRRQKRKKEEEELEKENTTQSTLTSKKKKKRINCEKENNIELEDFEVDVSNLVSKKEAKEMYCLPEGTLAVCEVVVERENPRNKGFSKMKLYDRSDIRERARKRFGGIDGLRDERNKRSQDKFERDLKQMKNIFS